ncbi:alpha/beta hydrolase [Conexibacter sp. JD483]|uniref:alpha/beta fold hydrolase n=1 Tax=unclassified Conexibacter TaxID=2627773 RepID=UPI0027202DBB|nr:MULTISPECIES: alpha/beta hydrolase [unclassified Conexibacter]MDO8187032.1 alpha/beta hydrolase [Conexibacter sp. CPCC 205706]MDO8200650.1 alpha/beta hydrolase [Conexibacter sp. CPCC 205762]MDR9371252.1 alpha/beta hydrolase [Conexibacter sp. JD483]
MEVTDHTGELDGQPVFWRSAPTPQPGETPTLYVHGVPTSSDDWLPFLTLTGGLAPDLLGFGRSGKGGQNDYSIEGIASFVERFLDLVGVPRVKLVVHDWGSAALAWAIRNPERVEKLVIVDAVPLLPGYRWHRVARLWRAPGIGELAMGLTFKLTLRRALRDGFAGPVPSAFTSAAWRHFDQGTQRAILRLYRSAPESRLAEAGRDLSSLTMPTLVVWGALDPYIPPRFGDDYAARISGSRVEHVTNAGHWPWVDRAELITRIATFLGDN